MTTKAIKKHSGKLGVIFIPDRNQSVANKLFISFCARARVLPLPLVSKMEITNIFRKYRHATLSSSSRRTAVPPRIHERKRQKKECIKTSLLISTATDYYYPHAIPITHMLSPLPTCYPYYWVIQKNFCSPFKPNKSLHNGEHCSWKKAHNMTYPHEYFREWPCLMSQLRLSQRIIVSHTSHVRHQLWCAVLSRYVRSL